MWSIEIGNSSELELSVRRAGGQVAKIQPVAWRVLREDDVVFGTPFIICNRPQFNVDIVSLKSAHRRLRSPTLSLGPGRTARSNLVEEVIRRLQHHSFVQIRGSPGSGKTILLHLVQKQLEANGMPVYRFDTPWPVNDEESQKKLHRELVQVRNSATSQQTALVIIIDEAQASYADLVLWNTYFKNWAGHPHPYCSILIACAWGSTTPHSLTIGPYPPLHFKDAQRINLRRTDHDPFGLLFEKAEIQEVFQSSAEAKWTPWLGDDLKDALVFWSSGYPAVVIAFTLMCTAKKEHIRRGHLYTLAEFFHDHSTATLLENLRTDGQCSRFLPKTDLVAADPRVVRVFQVLSLADSIDYNESDLFPGGISRSDLDFVHSKGFVDIEYLPVSAGSMRLSFTFPLQRALLQMILKPPVPDGMADIPTTLTALVFDVVRAFNPDHLTAPTRVHGLPTDTPMEATYQHEFFRCLYAVRPRAIMSSEYGTPVGSPLAGRIDFLVHRHEYAEEKRSWGLELLRNGDRLMGHSNRFDATGAYHEMRVDGMTDFLIIDFRTKVPTTPHSEIPDLLHVVFTDDYQSVEFYDHNLTKFSGWYN
ncbi:hypothetical protein B0H16DRAFT_566429 [Mycena metata]|uniref:Uncharacterized protein n=1 Tax=Mycena metata TaxID=1033252 RepID=A0AAD7MEA1_9AGAR|nr:hypothetical protein B0H16DRAFT_566429 [Mycena metata]